MTQKTHCIAIEKENGEYAGELLDDGWQPPHTGALKKGDRVSVGLDGWPTRLAYTITSLTSRQIELSGTDTDQVLSDLRISKRTGKAILSP